MADFIKIAFTASFARGISKVAPVVKSFVKSKIAPVVGSALGISLAENVMSNIYDKQPITASRIVDNTLTNTALLGGLLAATAGLGAGYSKIRQYLNPKYLQNVAAAKTKATLESAKKLLKLRAEPGGREYLKGLATSKRLGTIPSAKYIGAATGAYLGYDPEKPGTSLLSGAAKGALTGAVVGGPWGKIDPATFAGAFKESIRSMLPLSVGMKEYEQSQIRDKQRLIKQYYQSLQGARR